LQKEKWLLLLKWVITVARPGAPRSGVWVVWSA
jgi:hypothetical protein